ncbi:MAG: hypothetical protein ABI321_24150 [Polyangia bacterium]
MRTHDVPAAALLVALLVVGGARLAVANEGRYVTVYVTNARGERTLTRKVDLDTLPTSEWTGTDAQYDRTMRMRGVPLEALWSASSPAADLDLALLHFDDGLLVPVPFRDAAYMKRAVPRVIRANTANVKTPMHAGELVALRRPPTREDLRPVTLHGNKVVVKDAVLPSMLPSTRGDLWPWRYADSLYEVELVNRVGWIARFDAGSATTPGRDVYVGSCVLCHAVRGVGGTMGWDFVAPYPIYSDAWKKKFKGENPDLTDDLEREELSGRTLLRIHVRQRAGEMTRSMPALRGMTELEVGGLWKWLQAQALVAPR